MQTSIMKNNFDKELNKDFSSIEGIRRAEAPSWFFTKLEARMLRQANNSKNYWVNISAWLARPAVTLAGIFIIIFINVAVLFFKTFASNDSLAVASEQTSSDEYSQVSTTLFDYETIKP